VHCAGSVVWTVAYVAGVATTLSATGAVRRHSSQAGWFFLTVSGAAADDIRARSAHRGFGSVRVRAELGSSSWDTSVFPEPGTSTYLLPLKAEIRRREGLQDGDVATVLLHVD
jgi:hypothetical protein